MAKGFNRPIKRWETKWERYIVPYNGEFYDHVIELCDKEGEKGWEPWGFMPRHDNNEYVIYFKRRIA